MYIRPFQITPCNTAYIDITKTKMSFVRQNWADFDIKFETDFTLGNR